MRKLFLIIFLTTLFVNLAAEKTPSAKNPEKQTVVYVVRDKIKTLVPMSKTKEINPDSIQSVDIFRDTVVITMKPYTRHQGSTIK